MIRVQFYLKSEDKMIRPNKSEEENIIAEQILFFFFFFFAAKRLLKNFQIPVYLTHSHLQNI